MVAWFTALTGVKGGTAEQSGLVLSRVYDTVLLPSLHLPTGDWWICICQIGTLSGSETVGWKSYLPAGKVTADGISYQNLLMK